MEKVYTGGWVNDVKVDVAVVLGHTEKRIGDLKQMNEGTIIELDKLAGEPVDIVANGELIAKGEVVIIDFCFAVKIIELM